jgi:hypothetical protein
MSPQLRVSTANHIIEAIDFIFVNKGISIDLPVRYQNDHPQLKSTEIPMSIIDRSVETVKLTQSMQSTENNLPVRDQFCQQ